MSDLVVGPVCKNLVRIFQLSERAKKDAVADPVDQAAPSCARWRWSAPA